MAHQITKRKSEHLRQVGSKKTMGKHMKKMDRWFYGQAVGLTGHEERVAEFFKAVGIQNTKPYYKGHEGHTWELTQKRMLWLNVVQQQAKKKDKWSMVGRPYLASVMDFIIHHQPQFVWIVCRLLRCPTNPTEATSYLNNWQISSCGLPNIYDTKISNIIFPIS
jgi:hypothetical protein